MKRFQFRLDRLQKLREQTRERRRLALVEATSFRQRIERQIDHLESARLGERDSLRDRLTQSHPNVDSLIQARAYSSFLSQVRLQLDRQMDQIHRVIEQRRAELVVAERDVRILEKLRDKVHQRYLSDLDKEERLLLDELAGSAPWRESTHRVLD